MNKKMLPKSQLTRSQLHSRYNNMINRCYNEEWQKLWGNQYRGSSVCDLWLLNRELYFEWLQDEWYVVDGEQMDVDHNIIDHYNTVYAPDKCLIVPHSVNVLFETLEVGTTNIVFNSKNNTYTVKVYDDGEFIIESGFKTYNEALECYCAIKTAIIWEKADSLKDDVPDKVFNYMMQADVKEINNRYLQ